MTIKSSLVRGVPWFTWLLASGCLQFAPEEVAQDESVETTGVAEQSIIKGNLPGSTDPLAARVVLLPGCTGTLLTSQWVLTASHCVGKEGPVNPLLTPFPVATRTGASSQADWIMRHFSAPACCGNPPASNGIDVALIHLSMPLGNQSTSLSSSAPQVGQALTCYGYGNNAASFDSAGNRSGTGFGTLRVANLTVASFDADRYLFKPNAAGQIQWTGDSGGPCFDSGGRITGVQSNGFWNLQVPPSSALTVTSADQIRADRIRTWVNEELLGLANDFNRDRLSDILWHNRDTGETQIWYMNRASRIGRATVEASRDGGGALVSTPWSIVGSNDFNRDGSTDILWHNASSGETQIWYMSGASRIGRATVNAYSDGGGIPLIGAPWSIVGSNDFNRDGTTDILWHNASSGETQIWYMSGASRIGRATVNAYSDGGGIPLIGAPWNIVGSNDFNGDRSPDILWHNDTSGETQIWYMSGASRIGRATVNAYSDGGGIPLIGAPWRITNH